MADHDDLPPPRNASQRKSKSEQVPYAAVPSAAAPTIPPPPRPEMTYEDFATKTVKTLERQLDALNGVHSKPSPMRDSLIARFLAPSPPGEKTCDFLPSSTPFSLVFKKAGGSAYVPCPRYPARFFTKPMESMFSPDFIRTVGYPSILTSDKLTYLLDSPDFILSLIPKVTGDLPLQHIDITRLSDPARRTISTVIPQTRGHLSSYHFPLDYEDHFDPCAFRSRNRDFYGATEDPSYPICTNYPAMRAVKFEASNSTSNDAYNLRLQSNRARKISFGIIGTSFSLDSIYASDPLPRLKYGDSRYCFGEPLIKRYYSPSIWTDLKRKCDIQPRFHGDHLFVTHTLTRNAPHIDRFGSAHGQAQLTKPTIFIHMAPGTKLVRQLLVNVEGLSPLEAYIACLASSMPPQFLRAISEHPEEAPIKTLVDLLNSKDVELTGPIMRHLSEKIDKFISTLPLYKTVLSSWKLSWEYAKAYTLLRQRGETAPYIKQIRAIIQAPTMTPESDVDPDIMLRKFRTIHTTSKPVDWKEKGVRKAKKAKAVLKKHWRRQKNYDDTPVDIINSLSRDTRRLQAFLARKARDPTPENDHEPSPFVSKLKGAFATIREKIESMLSPHSPLRVFLATLLSVLEVLIINPFTLFVGIVIFTYFISDKFGLLAGFAAMILSTLLVTLGYTTSHDLFERLIEFILGTDTRVPLALITRRLVDESLRPKYSLTDEEAKVAQARYGGEYKKGIWSPMVNMDSETIMVPSPIKAEGDDDPLEGLFKVIFGVTSVKTANERFNFAKSLIYLTKELSEHAIKLYAFFYEEITGQEYIPSHHRGTVDKIKELVPQAINELHKCQNPDYIGSIPARDQIDAIYTKMLDLHVVLVQKPPPRVFMQSYMDTLHKLGELHSRMKIIHTGKSERKPPICIYLHGGPGLGKSTLIKPIVNAIRHCLGLPLYDDDQFYMLNSSDDYMTGYDVRKKVIYIDDAFQLNDRTTAMREVMEIIRIVNTAAYKANMADLASKGTTFIEPDFLVVTSNQDDLPDVDFMTDIGALHRRLSYAIEISALDKTKPPEQAYTAHLTNVDGQPIPTRVVGLPAIIKYIAHREQNKPPPPQNRILDSLITATNPLPTALMTHSLMASAAAQPNPEGDDSLGVLAEQLADTELKTVVVPIHAWLYTYAAVSSAWSWVKGKFTSARNTLVTFTHDTYEKISTAAQSAQTAFYALGKLINMQYMTMIKYGLIFGIGAASLVAIGYFIKWCIASNMDKPDPEVGKKRSLADTRRAGGGSKLAYAIRHQHVDPHSKVGRRVARINDSNKDHSSPYMSSGTENLDADAWFSKMADKLAEAGVSDTPETLDLVEKMSALENAKLPTHIDEFFKNRFLSHLVRLLIDGRTGVGTLIDSNTVLTAAHVARKDSKEMVIQQGGLHYVTKDFTVSHPLPSYDMAIIRFGASTPPFPVRPLRPVIHSGFAVPDAPLYCLRRFGNEAFTAISGSVEASVARYGEWSMVDRILKVQLITAKGDSGTPIFDSKGQLIGMHVASAASEKTLNSYVLLIQREDFEVTPDCIVPEFSYISEPPDCLPLNGVSFLGKTKRKKLFIPNTSALTRSPFYGSSVLLPSDKRPAALTRNGDIQPLKVSLSKICEMPRVYLEMQIKIDVAKLLAAQLGHVRLPACLSLEEAIFGVRGTHLKPIDMKTSSGPEYQPDLNPKSELWENDPGLWLANIVTVIYVLQNGGAYFPEFHDTLKDELRPHEKVDIGKTRAINVANCEFAVVWRMFYGAVFDLCNHNVSKSFSGLGIDAHSEDWGILYRSFAAIGNKILAGDYKSMDYRTWSELFEISRLMREILLDLPAAPLPDFLRDPVFQRLTQAQVDRYNKILSDRKVPLTHFWLALPSMPLVLQRIRSTLWRCSVTSTVHCVNGSLYLLFYKLASGHAGTTDINTTNQAACAILSFVSATKMAPAKFFDFNRMIAYGDDGCIAVDNRIQDVFNMTTHAVFCASVGMEFTAPDKTDLLPDFLDLDEVTFLKRRFVVESASVQAPLDRQLLDTSLQWTRAPKDPVLRNAVLVDKLRGYMYEFSHYPKEEFDQAVSRCRALALAHSLKLPHVNFTDARSGRGAVLARCFDAIIEPAGSM